MLTYKKWKQLNESFGSVTLGLSTPSTLGGVVGAQNITPEEAEGIELEEGKEGKEGKKGKCKCGKKQCICSKKMLDMDPEVLKQITTSDDDKEVETDVDATSDEDEVDVDELGDESDEEITDAEEDEEEEENGDEDKIIVKKSIKEIPPMMQKKKMCAKKHMKKKMGKKNCKHMTKEDAEWWQSIHDMMDVRHTTDKHWDGISEDQLYAPKDANEGLDGESEPGPGEPGYAPQTRIGTPFGKQ